MDVVDALDLGELGWGCGVTTLGVRDFPAALSNDHGGATKIHGVADRRGALACPKHRCRLAALLRGGGADFEAIR